MAKQPTLAALKRRARDRSARRRLVDRTTRYVRAFKPKKEG